uniref:Nicotianamine synthase n=1 Tax=Sedum alfredii TaxID=439688 RepID=A0A3Q9HGN4_9MAGN|nr:nicotianamine synthase [Sedum alfredii]
MGCSQEDLVSDVFEIYQKLSALESLKPSKEVNMIFTNLVQLCVPPNPVEVTKLPNQIQEMRSKLIKICGEAEGLMESHYSKILGSFDSPLDHLDLFPYYTNYIKLGQLEFNILRQHYTGSPTKIAFVGSGPLPLTSVVLASNHLPDTTFHNYDIDESANSLACALISAEPDLSKRMIFHTQDIMSVTDALKEYDVVFLAALVGMDKEAKIKVIDHLAKHMSPGATLMLRSAHAARAFLYPVIDPNDLCGFEVLSIYHPTDEVINSVVIAKKTVMPAHHKVDPVVTSIFLDCKSEIRALEHGNAIEELKVED